MSNVETSSLSGKSNGNGAAKSFYRKSFLTVQLQSNLSYTFCSFFLVIFLPKHNMLLVTCGVRLVVSSSLIPKVTQSKYFLIYSVREPPFLVGPNSLCCAFLNEIFQVLTPFRYCTQSTETCTVTYIFLKHLIKNGKTCLNILTIMTYTHLNTFPTEILLV